MTHIGLASALCAGAIVGLLASAFAPAYNLLLGFAVAAATAAMVLFGRAAFAPDEDTEPEVRPPDFQTRYRSNAVIATEEDDL
jgi:hypothetical protein